MVNKDQSTEDICQWDALGTLLVNGNDRRKDLVNSHYYVSGACTITPRYFAVCKARLQE
jgi:hypothetical protein